MKGNKKVNEFLNAALKNELTAMNQYFLHSRMLRDWGVTKLAAFEFKEFDDESHHADLLIKRILFLDGRPNLQELGKLMIGDSVKKILECDHKLETAAIATLREAIAHCEKVDDYVSRHLFREILDSEEEQIDWIETQFEMIDRMGIKNYTQLQSGPAED